MVTHFWGRCSNRIESPFGSLVTMLFGFSFLLQSVAVSADAIPYPATVTYGGFLPYGQGTIQWGFDSQDAVCLWKMTSIYGVSYSHYSDDPTIPYTRGSCWYYYPSLNTNVEYPNAWHRAATCPQGGDVYNFEIAMCKCLPGEDFAPELYPARMCKPSAGCAVDPIPPYTPDPHPALIDELSPRMQTALACLQAAIRGQGGSSIFKSGYRPAAYNAHLQAVFDQRTKLKGKGSECAARKAELAIEEQRHDIGTKRPGNNSLHSIREAFDLKSSLSLDITNGLAIVCNAFAPYPLTDRNHFEHTR